MEKSQVPFPLMHSSIRKPAIKAKSFMIKPSIIRIIQTSVQFGGLPTHDPKTHILNFLETCDSCKYDGISDDAVRLRLFSFSLTDKAKDWLYALPPDSITSWDDLVQKFLARYFPPFWAKMEKDCLSFVQDDSEYLYEAWERYKELLDKCPHHGLPKWILVQSFYDGLTVPVRTLIDGIVDGAFTRDIGDESYELLEAMASTSYIWLSECFTPVKAASVDDLDDAILKIRMEKLAKTILMKRPSGNSDA